jgi:hypothetical protein
VVTGILVVGIVLTLARPTNAPGIAFRLPDKPDPDFERNKAAAAGAIVLRKQMRNPDSFKLASVLRFPDGAVCYEYRAQNGTGGMNVERAVLTQIT